MNKLIGCCTAAFALVAGVAAGPGMALAHHPSHEETVADGDVTKNRGLLHHRGQGHDTDLPDGHIPSNVNYGF